jgi:hypothetical protein
MTNRAGKLGPSRDYQEYNIHVVIISRVLYNYLCVACGPYFTLLWTGKGEGTGAELSAFHDTITVMA